MEKRWIILILSILTILLFGIVNFSPSIGGNIWIIPLALWIILLILVPTDARSRGKSGPLWAFLTLILGPIGGIIYFILAKKKITV